MAEFGYNYPYGDSFYKDEGEVTINKIEPVILVSFENRAFYFSHRSDSYDRREYRMGEYMRHGLFVDQFIFGG